MSPTIKTALLSVVASACLATAGCSAPDVFGELNAAPPSHSSLYEGPSPPRPRVRSPKVYPRPDAGSLSLAHCVYLALENNPETRISWRRARARSQAIGQARSLFLPELTLTSNVQRRKIQVLTEVEDQFLRTTYSTNFGVRQLLIDGGTRDARVNVAMADLRTADFRHNSTLLDVALATEVAYYRLLAAQSLLTVAEDTLKQRTRHLRLARNRLDAGLGREVEVFQAMAEQADARLALVEARNQVRVMRGRLASAMGLPVTYHVEIERIPERQREVEQIEVGELLGEAAENRPRLKVAASEVTRLHQVVALREAARLPEVNAGASYGWRALHSLQPESDEYTMEVTLQWPLFTGFERTYSIREARDELRRAIASYESELQGVELEVWEAYSELVRTEEALQAAQVFVASARQSLETTENAYRAGKATIVELIDAQTTLTRARNRKESARLEWYTAIVRLERSVGRSWELMPQNRERLEPQRREPGPPPEAQARSVASTTLELHGREGTDSVDD